MIIKLGDTIKDYKGREGEVVNIGIATDKYDIAGELGLSAKEIKALKYEADRVNKIIELTKNQ